MRLAPTPRGAGLAVAGVLALMAAYAFGTQELVPVGVGLMTVPVLALGVVALAAARIRPERTVHPGRARAGDVVEVRTSTGRRGPGITECLVVARVDARAGRLGRPAGGAQRPDRIRVIARRGVHGLAPPVVEVTDPFGLARAARPGRAPDEVMVLARVVPLGPPGRLLRVAWIDEGRRGAAGWGDLDRVREYRRGDPLARIHWRQTAKRGELQTKVMRGSDGERAATALVLDATGAGGGPVDFEEAVTVVASLAQSLVAGGAAPSVVCAGSDTPPAVVRGARQGAVDQSLATVAPGGGGDTLAAAVRGAAGDGGVVVVSAQPSADLVGAIRGAGGRGAAILVGAAVVLAPELRAAGIPVLATDDAASLVRAGRTVHVAA